MKKLLHTLVAPLTRRLDAISASQRVGNDQVRALRLQGGAVLTALQRVAPPNSIREAEFKVFSQFGEDGILQFLLRNVGDVPRTFVEFGVESYDEANTRLLLEQDNWKGLIIDASETYMSGVRKSSLYWRHDLTAVTAFIDADNINGLISAAGLSGPIGLLSVDIDGNDYWVWKNISVVDPIVVVAEYNSVFGKYEAVTIPYDPQFTRTSAHFSNLFWGCSLKALCHLAEQKGMAFMGCNSAGNNAFFVKRGWLGSLRDVTPEEGYVESRFRESRGLDNNLTLLAGRQRMAAIADMTVVDVVSGQTRAVRDLYCGGEK